MLDATALTGQETTKRYQVGKRTVMQGMPTLSTAAREGSDTGKSGCCSAGHSRIKALFELVMLIRGTQGKKRDVFKN